MKGAPEHILDRCSTILCNGEDMPITDAIRTELHQTCQTLGDFGESLIGLCDKFMPEDKFPFDYPFKDTLSHANFPTSKLRFIGIISLIDPPRPAVPDAVAKCRKAGIKVIVITGDHPNTATAFARTVGILSEPNTTKGNVCTRIEDIQLNSRYGQRHGCITCV